MTIQEILDAIDNTFNNETEILNKQKITSFRWFSEQQNDIIKELKDNDIKSKIKLTEVLQKYNNEYNKKLKEKKK